MAVEAEKLIVSLEARINAFEKALARANATANRQARGIEKRFLTVNKTVTDSFTRMGSGVAKAFAIIGGARGAQQLSDSATSIRNSLSVAGLAGGELQRTFDNLYDSAQRNSVPIESLAQLYSRLSLVQGELGVASGELQSFVDNVGKSLRVSGTDAQAASGALLQLAQALGSNKVQMEEYSSLIDGTPALLQAAANGIEQTGGSVSKLTQLVKAGKVSNKALFDGIEAGAGVLDQRLAGSVQTVEQRFVILRNAMVKAADKFNQNTAAASAMGDEFDKTARYIDALDFTRLVADLGSVAAAFNSAANGAQGFAEWLGKISGLENVGAGIIDAFGGKDGKLSAFGGLLTVESTLNSEEKVNRLWEQRLAIQKRINETRGNPNDFLGPTKIRQDEAALTAINEQIAAIGGRIDFPKLNYGQFPPPKPVPQKVDLDDPRYKPAPSTSGSGSRTKLDEYEREVKQLNERTTAVRAQTAAMAELNPLVDDFGYSLQVAQTKQDLLTAAQNAGVKITPDVKASIEAMASGYASATSAAERLAATQDKIRERNEFFAESVFDAFSDILPAIETGNKALDRFLSTMIDAVAQAALLGKGPLAAAGGGGGLLGSLFGGLKLFGLAQGGIVANGTPLKRFASGGVSRSASIFGEAGPEAAVPLPDGRRIPVDLRMPSRGDTGATVLNYSPTINAPNSDVAAIARLERGQRDIAKNFGKLVDDRVRNSRLRHVRP